MAFGGPALPRKNSTGETSTWQRKGVEARAAVALFFRRGVESQTCKIVTHHIRFTITRKRNNLQIAVGD